MKLAASILALAVLAAPLGALASDHSGGSSGGGSHSSGSSSGGSHAAPPARSAPAPRSAPIAPAPRSAPVAPAPRSAPVAPAPRFAPIAPVPRTAPVGGEPRLPRPPVRPPSTTPVQPLPIYRARTPVINPPPPVPNAVPNPPSYAPWGWNGGIAWIGYDGYWGNGFWGPLAYGLGAAAYVVIAGSPGAQLLQAYQLTQTPCGPPNLVEIYGPDGSEICAFPNALVAPGVYYVDYDTLTLYTKPPQTQNENPN